MRPGSRSGRDPCIKRNASGVAGAFVAAEMALAGIDSAIPADEVIWSMKRIGDIMSPTLKETAEGGLAATPTEESFTTRYLVPVKSLGGCSMAVPAVIHKRYFYLNHRNSCK